jgi:predicted PurR-regulated permease PerM
VRLVPHSHEKVAREFLVRLVLTMRGWMTAQLISMTVVGVLTAVGLLALGVKGWLVLALVNFTCEFVPYVGPFVGAVPGVGVAFATSTQTGVYALILYLVIQQIEGYVVSPLAMRHEVQLAPPLLLIWQVLMGAAFGAPALLVATPLLACVKVALDYFWVERTLGKAPAPVPGRT